LDNAKELEFKIQSCSILGAGINRKRKSYIPDEELYLWKKELRSESLRSINSKAFKNEK
jgi:hypothetical protein